ncbi:MAG: HNH endonuclease [Verrucomicrobia bacterium]|nr:HNH endonuclease [Verrucomicrobiota bacterium]
MRQEFDELTFQIEHIVPRKHHGGDDADNLALACFACNNHKGTNLSGIDTQTGEMTRLFHPRQDKWEEHFKWKEAMLVGRTRIGRATVDVLAINLSYRSELRMALIEEGVFP